MNESEIPALVTLQNKPKLTDKPIIKINFREPQTDGCQDFSTFRSNHRFPQIGTTSRSPLPYSEHHHDY